MEKGFITWKDIYKVDITLIDEQHQKWINIFNNFYDSFKNRQSQIFVLDTLKAYYDYTKYHFFEEEKLFQEYLYPEANAHIKEHNEFIQTLTRLHSDYKKNNLLLSLKTIESLKDWFIGHILGTDKEFGEYVKKNPMLKK